MCSKGMTIGALSKATETNVETIRYYERIGLLERPGRTASNYRAYLGKDLERLRFIRRARDLGFAIKQIRELLGLADQKMRSCKAVDEIARAHLADVDRKLADLASLRGELEIIIRQCDCGTINDCRIIEALGPSCRMS